MPIDITENYIRIRQASPGSFDSKSFRTIDISPEKGIRAVVGCSKGNFIGNRCKTGMRIQTYLFSKEKWNLQKAKAWISEHKKEEFKAFYEGTGLWDMYYAKVWSTAGVNDYPDSSFAYVEPGEKDKEGKTVPRSKRHLPYKDASGQLDPAHIRNGLARLNQTHISPAAKATAKRKLCGAVSQWNKAHPSQKIESGVCE